MCRFYVFFAPAVLTCFAALDLPVIMTEKGTTCAACWHHFTGDCRCNYQHGCDMLLQHDPSQSSLPLHCSKCELCLMIDMPQKLPIHPEYPLSATHSKTPGALARSREALARSASDRRTQHRDSVQRSPSSAHSPGTPHSQPARSPGNALENAKIPETWMATAPSSSFAGNRAYDKPWMVGAAVSVPRDSKKRKGDVRFKDSIIQHHSDVESGYDEEDQKSARSAGSAYSQQHRSQKKQQPGSSSPASPNDIPWTDASATESVKNTSSYSNPLPLPPHHRSLGDISRPQNRNSSPPSLFDIANSSPSFDFQNMSRVQMRGSKPSESQAAAVAPSTLQKQLPSAPFDNLASSFGKAAANDATHDTADVARQDRLHVVVSLEWLMKTHLLQVSDNPASTCM